LAFDGLSIWLNCMIFAVSAIVVWLAGGRLAVYVDGIADQTGIGQAFTAMLLLGGHLAAGDRNRHDGVLDRQCAARGQQSPRQRGNQHPASRDCRCRAGPQRPHVGHRQARDSSAGDARHDAADSRRGGRFDARHTRCRRRPGLDGPGGSVLRIALAFIRFRTPPRLDRRRRRTGHRRRAGRGRTRGE